jgi:nucleoside 2-deoxyribosyltransferase
MKFYLCGSVAGRSARETREERLAAASAIHARGWAAVDPLAGEYDAHKGLRKVTDADAGLSSTCIALKDRWQIDHVDALLWLTADVPTYGSCIEVGYAWAKGIAIIAVDATKRGRRSAFVEHCSTFIADDLEQALQFVADYLVPDAP